jgi:hypothetical protein
MHHTSSPFYKPVGNYNGEAIACLPNKTHFEGSLVKVLRLASLVQMLIWHKIPRCFTRSSAPTNPRPRHVNISIMSQTKALLNLLSLAARPQAVSPLHFLQFPTPHLLSFGIRTSGQSQRKLQSCSSVSSSAAILCQPNEPTACSYLLHCWGYILAAKRMRADGVTGLQYITTLFQSERLHVHVWISRLHTKQKLVLLWVQEHVWTSVSRSYGTLKV